MKCTKSIEKFPFQEKCDEQLKEHCEVCDNLLQNKAKMMQHKQTHVVRCGECKDKFYSPAYLSDHMQHTLETGWMLILLVINRLMLCVNAIMLCVNAIVLREC